MKPLIELFPKEELPNPGLERAIQEANEEIRKAFLIPAHLISAGPMRPYPKRRKP